jgi:membrane-bound lytic murein transglycosylase D
MSTLNKTLCAIGLTGGLLGVFAFGPKYINQVQQPSSQAYTFFSSANVPDSLIRPQHVAAPKIPIKVSFAKEPVPLDNFDVRERLDRELISNCFRHSATFLYIKRANRFFPIIEPILKKYGIPDDFKYLAVAESGLSNAVSPAGARGLWQFMPASGKEYGLIINSDVDERYHLEKATVAACKYLKTAYKRYNNWTLASASYNMGKAGLSKRLRLQSEQSYYDLNLNSETSRYVFRIIALKLILQNPKDYGFFLVSEDLYPEFPNTKDYEVKTSISSLATFADKQSVSYRMLKVLNPWLRTAQLSVLKGQNFKIKLPSTSKKVSDSSTIKATSK